MSIPLSDRVMQLQNERKKHAAAIAAIDQALQGVSDALGTFQNLSPSEAEDEALRIDLAMEQVRAVRRRGKFANTAEVSVLEFIRASAAPTTAEINAHWRNEARCGTANVTLLKLLRQGAIQRVSDPTIRGSRYIVSQFPAADGQRREEVESAVFSADMPGSMGSYQ
jgi:hypothetical protein